MTVEQIESLIKTPEQELLSQWYDEELKRTVGGSAKDLVSTIGDLREAFLNWAAQIDLRDLICRQWDYQSKKKQFTTTVQLASALCDFLVALTGYPSPATVSVIIVQWAGDKLCDVS